MIKNNVFVEEEVNLIDFDTLKIGDTFIIRSEDYDWLGMKCEDVDGKPYIIDLSEMCGLIVEDVHMYKIIRLIDLKLEKEV